jgi:hypothetical protein
VLRQRELEDLLAGLPANDPAFKEAVAQAARFVEISRGKVYIQITPLRRLIEKAIENPDDAYAVHHLGEKLHWEVYPLLVINPDEGARVLTEVRGVFDRIEPSAKSDLTKQQLERGKKWADSLGRTLAISLERRDAQRAKVGQDALPMKVETWINGSPLSPDDIKGHVVLLDFFSVYEFSQEVDLESLRAHLQQLEQWQRQYSERGLITIGITTYHNFRWSNAKPGPVRINQDQERVPPAEEQDMLKLLAQQHGLKHRLAIMVRDEHVKAITYYPAMDYPHLAVIDRNGKIHVIRGGKSAHFTDDISRALESLLGPASPGQPK